MRPPSEHKKPVKNHDYICNIAISLNPTHDSSSPNSSFGKAHHLGNHVTYDHLSCTHKAYLVSLDFVVELRSYSEMVHDPQWLEANSQGN